MEIKIKKNIEKLKEVIKIIENVNPEVDFVFCPEELIIKTACPSAISMISFRLKKELFEEYNIEKEIICTFQVEHLMKIIKKVGKKEMTIKFDETKVHFISKRDKFTLKYFVGEKDDRAEPKLESACVWDIKSNELIDILKDFKTFSEVIKIEGKDDKLYFHTKSEIVEGTTASNAKPQKYNSDCCWYALPNFMMIAPISKIFKELLFEYEKDKPCQITAESSLIKFKWILAPRVE